MKREFLKAIEGLSDEAIDKIMAEHGKTIELKKNEVDTLKTTNETLKSQMSETQSKLKEFESMDIDGIKKATDELKSKYETETKTLSEQLQKQQYEFSAKEYLNTHKFANELTKEAVLNKFMHKEFKYEDGKFLGADDFIGQLKESQPNAFLSEQPQTKPSFGSNTSDSKDGQKTSDEIFGEKFEKAVLG